jgi:hypothetical protein
MGRQPDPLTESKMTRDVGCLLLSESPQHGNPSATRRTAMKRSDLSHLRNDQLVARFVADGEAQYQTRIGMDNRACPSHL